MESQTSRLPMVLVGGFVLVISIAAFFRTPLLPAIGVELSMSAGQLGWLTTIFAVGRLVTDLPAGRLSDRRSPALSFGFAGLVLAVGSTLFSVAPSPGWVLLAALVLGVASATANTTGMTFFSGIAGEHQRGTALAAFSASLLGGQALGPAVGGLLGGATGWRSAMLFASGLGAIVFVVAWLCRQRISTERGPTVPVPAGDGQARPERARVPSRSPEIGHREEVQLAILYGVPFSIFFMMGALPQTIIPILGDESHGLGPNAIGLALGVGGACRFVGVLVGGRIADRVSRKAALVPGLVLSSLGVGSLAFDLGVPGWVGAIVLLSLGSYGFSTAATMMADRSIREGRSVGRRLGGFRFVGDLGLIAGPATTAFLYERVGRPAVLAVAILLAALSLAAASLLEETRPARVAVS